MKFSKWSGALALSLLVFPGTGHFLYKRWTRGVLWGGSFGLILLGVMMILGANVSKMMDGMMSASGDVAIDMTQLGLGAGLGALSFVVWGLAGADTWWIARQEASRQEGTEATAPGEAREVENAPAQG